MPDDPSAPPRRPSQPPEESLARWLLDRGLLRGPFAFVDYWASVLGLDGVAPERREREGLVDRALFRLGIDRPDLEVPSARVYLLLLVPFLLPFFLRRGGRARFRFLRGVGEEIEEALAAYRLALEPTGDGRVDVRCGETVLARGVLDPFAVPGFCGFFWAIYKLPLALLSAILIVALLAGIFYALGLSALLAELWLAIAVPVLVLVLYLLYREWPTAVLGALPVVIGRYLFSALAPGAQGWLPFLAALVGLFALYLLIDWLFMPRPVPPALLLYTAEGPARPYAREQDAPHWLEGETYWVWRYMILAPAELNKFWERDWERVELWIRADGPSAGALEWVVTDMHYRELWIPGDALAAEADRTGQRSAAARAAEGRRPGFWLLEVDADTVFHYPFFRTLSFVPDEGAVPARGVRHLLRGLRERAHDEDVASAVRALERARLRRGEDVLGDVPELVVARAREHLLAQPWRYWRYPLGAATPRAERIYGDRTRTERPPAADPALQIKERHR